MWPPGRGDIIRIDARDVAVGSEAGTAHPLFAAEVQDERFRYGQTVLVVPLTTTLAMNVTGHEVLRS